MAGVLVRARNDSSPDRPWWLVNPMGRRWVTSLLEANTMIFLGQASARTNNQPHEWDREQVAAYPAMPGYRLPRGWS